MKKKNLFKEMLKKQEKHEIELGSREEWILQWLDRAQEYDNYDGEYDDNGELLFSHYDNLYCILEGCKDLDEMEDEIIGYSFTDEGWSESWREDRIIE